MEANTPDLNSVEEARAYYETQLQQEVERRKSLESEFLSVDSESKQVADKAKKRVVQLVPDAHRTLEFLVNYADSETVRFQAAKYIMETTMTQDKTAKDNDEFEKLVAGLRGKSAIG